MAFKCDECGRDFSRRSSLNRHKGNMHGGRPQRFTCVSCNKDFNRRDNYHHHLNNVHCRKRCHEEEDGPSHLEDSEDDIQPEQQAFDGTVATFGFQGSEEDMDPREFLVEHTNRLTHILAQEFKKRRGIKWSVSVKVKFDRPDMEGGDGGNSFAWFHGHTQCSVNMLDSDFFLQSSFEEIIKGIEEYTNNGSGWILDHIELMELWVGTYKPLGGHGKCRELPNELDGKHSLLNLDSANDGKCFLWAVLSQLHRVPSTSHPQKLYHYRQYENELDMVGLKFPITLNQIRKFEIQNQLSVCIFGWDEELFPLYVSNRGGRQIDLLLYEDHYVAIKNLDQLLCSFRRENRTKYHCRSCMQGFNTTEKLEQHKGWCTPHGPQKVTLPDEKTKWLEYTQHHMQLPVPYVIYADFESVAAKIHGPEKDPSKSGTTYLRKHIACAYSYVVVGPEGEPVRHQLYRNKEGVAAHFLEQVEEEVDWIVEELKQNEPMEITEEDMETIDRTTACSICEKPLGNSEKIVKDHCHRTGRFRGLAHNGCNLKLKYSRKIPVIIHNLKGYDSHLIMQELGRMQGRRISCIAQTSEKYITFGVGRLQFIDSLQFLNTSLDSLVTGLTTENDGADNFPILSHYYPEERKRQLLMRKGVFPYDYLDTFERCEETSLPPRESFFNMLTQEHISEADYHHAESVWEEFGHENLGDYLDTYLMSDTLLLADVFQNFRAVCQEQFKLDPPHVYTSPGIAWVAMLKMTGVKLELLTDIDMHLMIEGGIRGGTSMSGHRHARANNPRISSYNAALLKSWIMYLDANNLYGWAMSQYLPVDGFRWLTREEIERLDVTTVPDEGPIGMFLEVDLEYPPHLHHLHNDYPLAPESLKVTSNMLPPSTKPFTPTNVRKLIPNLMDKKHYVIHYRALKLYLQLGLKLVQIHRVIQFRQEPWLKKYIDFNTEQRKLARTPFRRDQSKLCNNAVFGKTMENLRLHCDFRIVNEKMPLEKLLSSVLFKRCIRFDDNLCAVQLRRKNLLLNRPIYLGFSILDMSKVLMYKFHYHHMMTMYGPENCRLLYTDTDILIYHITTEDVYADMGKNSELYDTSDYPSDHPLYSVTNKKKLGVMKDELSGKVIEEFVGLKAKMYSILDGDGKEKKTAKGVCRHFIRNKLRHEHYVRCLKNLESTKATSYHINHELHVPLTIKRRKVALTPHDNKRYTCEDGASTLAYGHHKIRVQQVTAAAVIAVASLLTFV